MPPSTPKAGSSLVSRTIGVAEADADADVDADDELEVWEDVAVGVIVLVTVKTVGTTVATEETRLPDRVMVVIVTELVVRLKDTERV